MEMNRENRIANTVNKNSWSYVLDLVDKNSIINAARLFAEVIAGLV
jgi:hypothetical protein